MAARLRDYDWDGVIGTACAEIAALLRDGDYDQISTAFWRHYRSLDAVRHLNGRGTPEAMAHAHAHSARYARMKYVTPFDDGWRHEAEKHADRSLAVGVPLPALLAALAYAHSRTLELIEERLGDGSDRMRTLADVVQRLSLVESDIMAAHLTKRHAHAAREERRARSTAFRQSIADSIEGTAALGNRIRVQAIDA